MADAQYIIDIAASLPDGAATVAELDNLTESLIGAGKRSDEFSAAVKRVSAELDTARAASSAANAALSAGNDQYAQLEREALRAAKAVEKANEKGRVSPGLVQQAINANVALKAYEGTLKGLEGAAAKAGAEQGRLEKQLRGVEKIGAHVDSRNAALLKQYRVISAAVGDLPGPLGRLGRSFVQGERAEEAFAQSFGSGAAIALKATGIYLGLAIAIGVVTTAAVVGYAAFARYAIATADAGRSAALSREAFASLDDTTAAAVASFSAVTDATGLADDRLYDLSKQLRAAKVSAADMPSALRAAALAEAALGKGGASDFIARIKDGTESVSAFAEEARSKFGGVVSRQLLGLDAQSERFGRLWAKLFENVNLEPVLSALKILVDMFEKGAPLAEFLGASISGAFEPIASVAESAAFAVEAFALGVAIQMTKMYVAIRPTLAWLDDLLGPVGFGGFETAGKIVAVALAAATAGFAVLSAVILGPLATALALGALLLYGLINAFYNVASAVFAVVGFFYDLGKNLITGLVQGIIDAAPAVLSAVSGAITGAIDAAKSLLGIASPSKVFAEIGDNTVAGFTGAVEAGAGEASGSMARLLTAEPKTTGAAAGASSESKGRASFDFSGASFTFVGVDNADTARDKFSELLTSLLEGDADSIAGARVPA